MKKLAIALAVLATASAHAYDINSAANPALAGGSVIDFESAAAGSYSSLTVGGVSFTTGAGTSLYVNTNYAGNYNTVGKSLANTYSGDAFGLLTLTFSAPTKAFGFNWGAADTVWTLSAYDASNNLLGSRSLDATRASNAGEFFGLGFASDIAYATIAGNRSDYVFVDNLTLAAAVPEPSAYGLMAIGLAGLGFAARRRKTR